MKNIFRLAALKETISNAGDSVTGAVKATVRTVQAGAEAVGSSVAQTAGRLKQAALKPFRRTPKEPKAVTPKPEKPKPEKICQPTTHSVMADLLFPVIPAMETTKNRRDKPPAPEKI